MNADLINAITRLRDPNNLEGFPVSATKPAPRSTLDWIPVTQELPDSDLTVLIACADGNEPVWTGYHNGTEWLTVEGSSFITVTHWMPLPEPPSLPAPTS